MSLYAPGTFSGNYIPQGDISEADCIVGHEFGYRKNGYGNVNQQLARLVAGLCSDLPLFLNRNIAGALNVIAPEIKPAEIFSGESTNITGQGEGTWGELSQARLFMNERQLNQPILVAQAYHVGRITLQAKLLEIDLIVPEGLPRDFDPESAQLWARGPVQWAIREALGVPVLRIRNRM